MAVASGLVSSLLVLRRMTLMSDALSHVALPGIAIGIMFKFQPLLGGLAFLFLGIFLIWKLEFQTKLAAESLTGVIFTTALALGSLLASEADLLEAFFGDITKITVNQMLVQNLLAIIVIVVSLKYLKPLVLLSIAPELAASVKLSPQKLELMLLSLIAITISIGVSFVGVLLMSSLLIIPAVIARQLTKSFYTFVALSILFAVVSLVGGLVLSLIFQVKPGITSVLLSTSIFVVSLFFGKK